MLSPGSFGWDLVRQGRCGLVWFVGVRSSEVGRGEVRLGTAGMVGLGELGLGEAGSGRVWQVRSGKVRSFWAS